MSASDAVDRPVFAPIVAASIVGIGILSCLFYIVFAAYAPDLGGEDDPRANALSQSAIGFAALAQFLDTNGIPVLVSRGIRKEEIARASLVIVTPSLENTKEEILAIGGEPKLVILPKWQAAPDPTHHGWVTEAGTYTTERIETFLLRLSPSSAVNRGPKTAVANLDSAFSAFGGRRLKTGQIDSLQTISGSNWVGYIDDADGRSVLSRLEGSSLYVLSDPDLLNTHGLKDLDTARTAVSIIQGLRSNSGPVIFDITLAGYRRSPNFLRLLFEPPMVATTLCALVVVLLMGIHAAIRFGAPVEGERVFAFGKQALIGNTSALITMARREHGALLRYAAATRRNVARAVGVPPDEPQEKLNELLDRMRPSHAPGPSATEIFEQAAAARAPSEVLNAARKIYLWGQEMIHGRR